MHSDIFSRDSWVWKIPSNRVHDLNKDGPLPIGHGKKKPVSMWRSGQVQVLLLDPAGQSVGGPLTPNFSVWPNDASVCSLSQVLVRGLIPKSYYLSSTACAGILRRAEKRGKTLPEPLLRALTAATGMTLETLIPASTSPTTLEALGNQTKNCFPKGEPTSSVNHTNLSSLLV